MLPRCIRAKESRLNHRFGVVFLRDYNNKPLFAPGLCYVALSRCQSLRDLLLRDPLSLHHFKVHEQYLQSISNEYDRLEVLFPQRISSLELKQRKRLLFYSR